MLRGNRIGLRARRESDLPVLHVELYDDVETRSRADSRPWRPLPPDPAISPFAAIEPDDDAAPFAVVSLDHDELAGSAGLWGIDTHNRGAHLGMSLRPGFRGRGLAVDIVEVLCAYGFTVRGLHRLQLETLADNTAMIRAASRALEGARGTARPAPTRPQPKLNE